MEKKYSKFKSKIHPLTYVIGAVLLAVIIVAIVLAVPSKKDKFYRSYYNTQVRTQDFKAELLIEKDNSYKYIKVSDLEKRIKNDEVVILYIGGTWCSYCLNEVGAYDSELKKNETLNSKVSNILYLEKTSNDKDIKGLAELFEKLELGDAPSTYPSLLVFINGKLTEVKYSIGTQDAKSIRTTVRNFYDEVVNELNEAR